MTALPRFDERHEIICLACRKATPILILGWDGRTRCLACHERFSRVTRTVRARQREGCRVHVRQPGSVAVDVDRRQIPG
jgi:hypothetical protein